MRCLDIVEHHSDINTSEIVIPPQHGRTLITSRQVKGAIHKRCTVYDSDDLECLHRQT